MDRFSFRALVENRGVRLAIALGLVLSISELPSSARQGNSNGRGGGGGFTRSFGGGGGRSFSAPRMNLSSMGLNSSGGGGRIASFFGGGGRSASFGRLGSSGGGIGGFSNRNNFASNGFGANTLNSSNSGGFTHGLWPFRHNNSSSSFANNSSNGSGWLNNGNGSGFRHNNSFNSFANNTSNGSGCLNNGTGSVQGGGTSLAGNQYGQYRHQFNDGDQDDMQNLAGNPLAGVPSTAPVSMPNYYPVSYMPGAYNSAYGLGGYPGYGYGGLPGGGLGGLSGLGGLGGMGLGGLGNGYGYQGYGSGISPGVMAMLLSQLGYGSGGYPTSGYGYGYPNSMNSSGMLGSGYYPANYQYPYNYNNNGSNMGACPNPISNTTPPGSLASNTPVSPFNQPHQYYPDNGNGTSSSGFGNHNRHHGLLNGLFSSHNQLNNQLNNNGSVGRNSQFGNGTGLGSLFGHHNNGSNLNNLSRFSSGGTGLLSATTHAAGNAVRSGGGRGLFGHHGSHA